MHSSLEIPDGARRRVVKIGRSGSGSVFAVIVTGSPEETALFEQAILSAVAALRERVDGPAPCLGCGSQ